MRREHGKASVARGIVNEKTGGRCERNGGQDGMGAGQLRNVWGALIRGRVCMARAATAARQWSQAARLGVLLPFAAAHRHCDEARLPAHQLHDADPAIRAARLHLRRSITG